MIIKELKKRLFQV